MSGRLDELIPTAKEIQSSPRHDVQGDRLEACPMAIIRSDDKRRARLNCIAHILKTIP
jgi:polyphosphate kinase 2 (PPK2 family)